MQKSLVLIIFLLSAKLLSASPLYIFSAGEKSITEMLFLKQNTEKTPAQIFLKWKLKWRKNPLKKIPQIEILTPS